VTFNKKDTGPREFWGELWKWVGQQLEMGDDSIVSMDNRRVALMMGIPHKEDLVRAQKNIMVKDAEQKSMHSISGRPRLMFPLCLLMFSRNIRANINDPYVCANIRVWTPTDVHYD
jgi:hypothetical protein